MRRPRVGTRVLRIEWLETCPRRRAPAARCYFGGYGTATAFVLIERAAGEPPKTDGPIGLAVDGRTHDHPIRRGGGADKIAQWYGLWATRRAASRSSSPCCAPSISKR